MTKIDKAIAIIKQGPAELEELEEHLTSMFHEERIELSKKVTELDLSAPMIVHFDYDLQAWYSDL